MKDIKRLSQNVCNSLRSSVVLFDLPRVVEELIFNSVEACATKVFIHVNVGAYYIKVEDDGYGVSRDGLVLLGENLETSKIHLLTDMEAYGGSLVCRGETLGSLSDVSLVEVLSKARGKPNSYCKIIKGRKCLFLGISDKRDVVGTTVIVRDFFYNQPVRRKCIQSRPKKVLHSVKKCVLRSALVNPEILFRVVDLESEAELLRTLPSPSPLHLISDVFGDEISNSLQEITFSDKEIKISGYISGPRDPFSTKAFQYVYINSRFVCKGPIHNLLNTLASSLQSSTEIKFDNGKRPRTQTYPAYILHISCPISMYDLTFEPSKTILEFKDWAVVLSSLKQVIWQFWEKLLAQQSQGKSFSSNDAVAIENEIQNKVASRICAIRKKKDVVWSPQSSSRNPMAKPSVDFKNHRLAGTVKRLLPELKPCGSNSGDVCQTNCSYQGQIADKEAFIGFKHDQMGHAKICCGMSTSDFNSVIRKDPIVSFESLKANSDTDCLGLRWGDNSCGGVGLDKLDLKANRGIGFEHFNAASYTCTPVEFESGHSKHLPLYDFTRSPGVDYDSNTPKLESMWHKQVDDSVLGNCQATRESDVFLGDSVNPFSPAYSSFTKASDFCDSLTTQLWENGFNFVSTERYIDSPHCASGRSSFDDSTYIYNFDAKSMTFENDFVMTEGVERSFKYMSDNSHGALYATSFKGSKFNCIDCVSPDIKSLCHGQLSDDISFRGEVNDEQDRWFLDHSEAVFSDNHPRHAFYGHMDVADSIVKHKLDKLETQDSRLSHGCLNIRSKRSQSAPPFYKGKCKFSIINASQQTTVEWQEYLGTKFKPGTICSLDEPGQPTHASQPLLEANLVEISPCSRESSGKVPVAESTDEALDNKQPQKADYNNNAMSDAIEGFGTDGLEYASRNLTKWRNHDSQPTGGDMRHDNNDDILDISSGLLHLAGSSLVPDSISRECLENARVLLQVDKKFIPVMAGDTLIIIDQHAADERIRLEELRRKVLSGEGNNISYLDEEQDLILPEIGFQMLHNYADQIQKWGWICNIHTECSESFSKNMNLMNKRPHAVTLLAVPCILGINLTDKDLLEYLEQLAETDGSSTLPPAVTRILNFKACRGAIMFGDSLLPSESSLIVEELKATSLCFQCAHGRPTTAPLLNMVSLHEQLTMLEMRLHAPENTWHGLSQHRPSIERAQRRLASAKRFQKG